MSKTSVNQPILCVGQWRSYTSHRFYNRGGAYLGRGVQGTQQAVPQSRLQGVSEEPPPADQIL